MQVRITDNFTANLSVIEQFLEVAGASHTFDMLLANLRNTLIPNLEQHPQLGRLLLEKPSLSVESLQKKQQLLSQANHTNIREYITGDYLILYVIQTDIVYLLAIKHHKQLSFDLASFWL